MKTIKEIFLEAVNVQAENEGILEVPEGKKVNELGLDHFVKLAKKKGLAPVAKALVNLERWNKDQNKELSAWAKDMIQKLHDAMGEK